MDGVDTTGVDVVDERAQGLRGVALQYPADSVVSGAGPDWVEAALHALSLTFHSRAHYEGHAGASIGLLVDESGEHELTEAERRETLREAHDTLGRAFQLHDDSHRLLGVLQRHFNGPHYANHMGDVHMLSSLRGAASQHRAQADTRCEVVVELRQDLTGRLDRLDLRTILHQLLLNAEHRMPRGGSVVIEADAFGVAGDPTSELPPGRHLRISARDQGPYIRPGELRDLLPFSAKVFSYPMLVCYAVAGSHGGGLRVASTPDEGTTFDVLLPFPVRAAP